MLCLFQICFIFSFFFFLLLFRQTFSRFCLHSSPHFCSPAIFQVDILASIFHNSILNNSILNISISYHSILQFDITFVPIQPRSFLRAFSIVPVHLGRNCHICTKLSRNIVKNVTLLEYLKSYDTFTPLLTSTTFCNQPRYKLS